MIYIRKLFLLILATVAYASCGWAQDVSVRYQGQLIGSRGVPLANQNVAVCTQPSVTTTQPCSPLATLATSTITSSGGANPLTTDSNGNFFFYAAPGKYTVQAYGPQVSGQFVQPDTILSCSPSGTCTFTGSVTVKDIGGTKYVSAGNPQAWAGTDACAWINSAIAALPLQGTFPSGSVNITGLASNALVTCATTVNAGSPYLRIIGPGHGALRFSCTMNADCFNTQEGTSANNSFGFYMGGFSLVGTGSTNANAIGIHGGDMVGGRFEDIQIDNFLGTSSACLWLENKNYFSENNIFLNVHLGSEIGGGASNTGCTKELRGSVNASAGANSASFNYNWFIGPHFGLYANETAISLEGGFWGNDTWSGLHVNVTTATGTTVLAMSGSTFPGSGVNTAMSGFFDWSGECTGCSGATMYNIPSGYIVDIRDGHIDLGTGFNYTLSGTLQKRLNDLPAGNNLLLCNYSATGVQNNCYTEVINNPASARTLSKNDPGANADYIFSTGYVGSKGLSIGGAAPAAAATGDFTCQRSATVCAIWLGGDGNVFLFRNGGLLQFGGTGAPANLVGPAAGFMDLGSTSTPMGNLWLGTAATNNFKFQPATATGARIITIADPISPTTVGLPLTIASGTATMTTAAIASQACGTVVTVAATGALTTDRITANDNAQPAAATNGVLIIKSWPTANNVNFFYCNPTAASVTPAAATLNWGVIR